MFALNMTLCDKFPLYFDLRANLFEFIRQVTETSKQKKQKKKKNEFVPRMLRFVYASRNGWAIILI